MKSSVLTPELGCAPEEGDPGSNCVPLLFTTYIIFDGQVTSSLPYYSKVSYIKGDIITE